MKVCSSEFLFQSVATIFVSLFVFSPVSIADEKEGKQDGKNSLSNQLSKATQSNSVNKYLLKYKFKKGEVLRWRVEQVFSTETRGNKLKTTANNRTVSTRKWEVKKIFENGNVLIVYSIEERADWVKISGQPEVFYDSRRSTKIPPRYADVAAKVGVPLATAELDPFGNVIEKKATYRDMKLGMGGFAASFPKRALAIGEEWTQNAPIQVRIESGGVKHVKTRKVYKLKSVKDEVALITMRTEVLTPVESPRIQQQIMQQINFGKIN